jgi:hypothetical protein
LVVFARSKLCALHFLVELFTARSCQNFVVVQVCRAHQVVEDGYEFFADRQLVTVRTFCVAQCSVQRKCGAKPGVLALVDSRDLLPPSTAAGILSAQLLWRIRQRGRDDVSRREPHVLVPGAQASR